MAGEFRFSYFTDFNTGLVNSPPMKPLSVPDDWSRSELSILAFYRHLDVWVFGPAIELLKQIEGQDGDAHAWSHSAFALLSIIVCYFELIGKTLNPDSNPRSTAGIDFRFGFKDVYGGAPELTDTEIDELCDRLRNGLYHIASIKPGLRIHHPPNNNLDCLLCKHNDEGSTEHWTFYVDPHLMARTLLNHFPGFIARVRHPHPGFESMPEQFQKFIQDHYTAPPKQQERPKQESKKKVQLLVYVCLPGKKCRGMGQQGFRTAPRVGDHICKVDDAGIEQVYEVVALVHSPMPNRTSGNLYVRHVGDKATFEQSLSLTAPDAACTE